MKAKITLIIRDDDVPTVEDEVYRIIDRAKEIAVVDHWNFWWLEEEK